MLAALLLLELGVAVADDDGSSLERRSSGMPGKSQTCCTGAMLTGQHFRLSLYFQLCRDMWYVWYVVWIVLVDIQI